MKAKPGRIKVILLFLLAVLILIQFYRPKIDQGTITGDIQAPAEVKAILKRSCYDCHSNQTDLKWFDKLAPANWLVADHIKKGKEGLNFSTWEEMAKPDQKAKLWEAVNQVIEKAMPLESYQLLHPEAKLSKEDVEVLRNYVSTLAPVQKADTAKDNMLSSQYSKWIKDNQQAPAKIPVALNGVAYIADYKNWKAISSTQRLDNGTMRVIFGNDVAIRAIKTHHTNPWPNGTIFAKVAWDQLTDGNGNITTGAFKQVEYMIKDDRKYASTAGWGWARFKTPELKPYGKTALFTTECINCHRPVKDNDFVFTSPIQH